MGDAGDQVSIEPFTLKPHPIENLWSLKVRVIGAGYSGIYLGIRIPQRLRNIDFEIYEKNDAVGGVWYENRYPGCACDIPGAYACRIKTEGKSRKRKKWYLNEWKMEEGW